MLCFIEMLDDHGCILSYRVLFRAIHDDSCLRLETLVQFATELWRARVRMFRLQ